MATVPQTSEIPTDNPAEHTYDDPPAFEFDPTVTIKSSEVLWPTREIRINGGSEVIQVGLKLFKLSDGTDYEVVHGMPGEPKTAITVVSRPALGTSIQGYNTHTLLQIAGLGYPSILVGPEYGHREGWRLRMPKPYTLAQSAHNEHQILDALGIDTIVTEGKSWGAMVGFGVNSLAAAHNRNVVYSELVDPVGQLDIKKMLAHPSQLLEKIIRSRHEVAAMAAFVGSLTVGRLLHYRKSLNLSPNFLSQTIVEGLQIINGESLQLAKYVPHSAKMCLQVFMDSLISQRAQF